MRNKIIEQDCEYILNSKCINWDMLRNSKVLISGATGLICSTIVKAFIYANEKKGMNISVYCLVRNKEKAEAVFADYMSDTLHFIESDVISFTDSEKKFDYVIHGASPTSSKYFIENPVETIKAGINGTENLLEKARKDNVKGFVYLSSMEAYGCVNEEIVLTEDILGKIDLSSVRSCYPETKRMCELLCTSYSSEYGVKAMSVRLAQTFGAGVSKDDSRVFSMMAKCAVNKENIVLLTKGESRHPYLYTAQAAEAIICVLLNGKSGVCYNAANPATYCSIYEMGCLVAKEFTNDEIKVVISESDENAKYPPASYLDLDIERIKQLGWEPNGSLADMYSRMMESMMAE